MVHFRNIFVPIVAIFFLLLAACHQDSATMQELSRIDTMVYHQGEREALPILKKMDTKGFNHDEKAYYSLLLTMAQYKCYERFTSDSVISETVDYYRKSDDMVKYLKALVAKGCVLEDMGNLDKAVEIYHQAEIIKPIADTAITAYAKLRLGSLHQQYVVGAKTISIEKYKEALQLYKSVGDKHYEMLCLSDLGSIYRDFKDRERQDSAVLFMTEAYHLADSLNDNYFKFSNLFIRAELYELIQKDYIQAKKYILKALSVDTTIIDHPRAHFCAASTYLHLGLKDSALYFLNNAPQIQTSPDSIRYFNLQADIALLDGDQKAWLKYHNQAHSMADSILIGSLNAKLLSVEKKYDHQLAVLNRMESEARLKEALLLAALLALSLLATCLMVWRYRNQLKMRQHEVEILKADLDGSLASLEQMQKRLDAREQGNEGRKAQSNELRAIINKQIDAVHQLMEWSYQYDGDKFAAKFREAMTLPGVDDDSNYWSNLQTLVNELHDNVLVKAQEAAGGTLNESELNLLALYCCGFSFTVIMVTMGYKNIGTVYNKKNQIAKKLNVPDLVAFLNQYANHKDQC